ncbi:hypothetical protein [Dyella sp.]|uniref:hypothetical protein n=1 Tax=Dyella sp. TaxID=1869338 RepID=UPI002ED53328
MRKLMHLVALGGFIFAGAAMAGSPPSSGLGQAWPNAQDVSSSTRFHVYVFVKDGVRFIQVNDTAGNVRAAIATAGNQLMNLPIGTASQVIIDSTSAQPSSAGEPVYQDVGVQISAQALSNGTLLFTAISKCDPVECNSRVRSVQPSSTTTTLLLNATTGKCDPVECNSRVNSIQAQPQASSVQILNTAASQCDPVECNSRINSNQIQ